MKKKWRIKKMGTFTINLFKKIYNIITDIIALIITLFLGLSPILLPFLGILLGGYITSIF